MFVKVTTDWTNLSGLEVRDINGTLSTLSPLPDDEYYIQLSGSKHYGPLGLYVWHGVEPSSSNTKGAGYILEGQQGHLVKGIDDIYIRGMNGPVEVSIRKVQ